MKKCDFKKLALMGIAGGAMLASQANAGEGESYSPLIAAHNCAGGGPQHSCSNSGPGGYGYQQPSYQPHACSTQPQQYWGDENYAPPTHSCSNQRGPQTASRPQPNQWNPNYTADTNKSTYDTGRSTYESSKSSSYGTQGKQMTESELLSQLNEEGKGIYHGLDAQGKALALKLASQTCKGQNECKGLNSCAGEHNSCAGRGSCAGTSPKPFTDKNTAVKVAAMKMAEKRARTNGR
jgi:hypothetical protein